MAGQDRLAQGQALGGWVSWLAQLTEDVLGKISTIKRTHKYDPRVMRHNAEVLTRLRDEILNLTRNNKPADE